MPLPIAIIDMLGDIAGGNYDAHLSEIEKVCGDRRKQIGQRPSFSAELTPGSWAPGDKAVLQNLRPKYMVGAPVTILRFLQKRYEVEIDPEWLASRQTRFVAGAPVTVTPEMLRRP